MDTGSTAQVTQPFYDFLLFSAYHMCRRMEQTGIHWDSHVNGNGIAMEWE